MANYCIKRVGKVIKEEVTTSPNHPNAAMLKLCESSIKKKKKRTKSVIGRLGVARELLFKYMPSINSKASVYEDRMCIYVHGLM